MKENLYSRFAVKFSIIIHIYIRGVDDGGFKYSSENLDVSQHDHLNMLYSMLSRITIYCAIH